MKHPQDSFPFIPHFAPRSHYWIAFCNLLVFTKAFAKCPYLLLKKTLDVLISFSLHANELAATCAFLQFSGKYNILP